MIQTKQNKEIETLQALADIIDSLNRRFPNGNNIFQRVSRLCEETGELAKAVNHREKMGIKQDKYGADDDNALLQEVQDVIGTALDIAMHYGLLEELHAVVEARYREHEAQNFHRPLKG